MRPNSTAPARMSCCAGPKRTSAATTSWRRTCRTRCSCALAAKVRPGVDVLFLDTGYHFVETIGTRDAVEAVYDVNIVNVTPETHGRQAGPAVRQGPVRPRAQRVLPDAQGRAAAARRWPDTTAWVTGIRRVEAPTRANAPLISLDKAFGLVKINPIAAWTDEEMQAYIDANDDPGQSPCDRRLSVDRLRAVHVQAGRGRRSAQRPLGRLAKTECGLHAS